jgi:hypothetical protein
MGDRFRTSIKQHSQTWIAVLLVITCLFVYLSNGDSISSNDNAPNRVLALSWLDQQTLNFDRFRSAVPGFVPYYFVEAPNGHLSSTYPIGVAIVTFPLYCIFYVVIQGIEAIAHLLGQPLDLLQLTSTGNPLLNFLEKLASSFSTAIAVLLFHNIVRLKFSDGIALLSTFIYAFCTSVWSINSQGIWQHSSLNLLLLAIVWGFAEGQSCDWTDPAIAPALCRVSHGSAAGGTTDCGVVCDRHCPIRALGLPSAGALSWLGTVYRIPQRQLELLLLWL